jgi:hypothetical protein
MNQASRQTVLPGRFLFAFGTEPAWETCGRSTIDNVRPIAVNIVARDARRVEGGVFFISIGLESEGDPEMLRRVFVVGAWALLTVTLGCGGESVKTVEVSGELKVGGKAMEGVEVHFVHLKAKGFGTTDAQGKFKLQAAPGDNKVYFSKIEGAGTAESGMDAGMMAAAATGGADPAAGPVAIKGQLIPDKYTRYETTDKSFNVPDAGSAAANFDLE